MASRKLQPCNRLYVRPYRPSWTWLQPISPPGAQRTSALYARAESLYLMPSRRCEERRRNYILECLERSRSETGSLRTYSGIGSSYGSNSIDRQTSVNQASHITKIYSEMDSAITERIKLVAPESYGIKRLRSICHIYERVWQPSSHKQRGQTSDSNVRDRGVFPYVDDTATVLSELTKQNIMRFRHRVNGNNHPIWAIKSARMRKRKILVKQKKRSISQESIRSLQSSLISNSNVSASSS